jgi:hypothetical protein
MNLRSPRSRRVPASCAPPLAHMPSTRAAGYFVARHVGTSEPDAAGQRWRVLIIERLRRVGMTWDVAPFLARA